MDSGASNLHPVVRGRPLENDRRSNNNFGNRDQEMAKDEGIPPAMADELSPQEDKQGEADADSPENTHEDVRAANFGANRRMDVVTEDESKEEMIFQPRTTPLYESVVGPEIPRRFDGESGSALLWTWHLNSYNFCPWFFATHLIDSPSISLLSVKYM